MSGIGWMLAVSSLPDGLVQAPAPSFGCREVAHQHTHACNLGGDPHGALIPRLLRAQSVAKVPMAAPTPSCPCKRPTAVAWISVGNSSLGRSAVQDRVGANARATRPSNASVSGLGHQETADEHGLAAQPVDDNNATTSPSRAPAASELQGRRQLAEREYRLTSRLRQRGHGEVGCSHTGPCTCRRPVVLEEETLQRSVSIEYSLVKAERLSPYESLWVDPPEALADSAGSASTSI